MLFEPLQPNLVYKPTPRVTHAEWGDPFRPRLVKAYRHLKKLCGFDRDFSMQALRQHFLDRPWDVLLSSKKRTEERVQHLGIDSSVGTLAETGDQGSPT